MFTVVLYSGTRPSAPAFRNPDEREMREMRERRERDGSEIRDNCYPDVSSVAD